MGAGSWEFIQSIFLVFGGLGLFLYGMNIMSDGLEKMAADRLRAILEKTTSNRFLGVLVGAIVTAIIQSSSATTVMVVGFVNAGLMNLTQAIGVIMGANIGTTITAQIIAFKIDPIAPLIIFIGFLLHVAFKNRTVKNLGYVLLGFGILFFGISVMGEPLKEFANEPIFQSLLISNHNPFVDILAGLVFTAIIQSSSATTGIVVALYLSGIDMPLSTAAFLILGSNIGTCITAVLASLTTNRESKRAALAHVLFNTIGCIVFGSLVMFFPGILSWIQETWPGDPAREIAMFHTMFNISTVVLLIGFVKPLALFVQKVIPELPEETAFAKRLIYLGADTMQTPTLAVTQVHREMVRMGRMTLDNLQLSIEAFFEKDEEKVEDVLERESTINFLNHQITAWVVRIWRLNLSESDFRRLGPMLHTVSDIERIADHAENIVEHTMLKIQNDFELSEEALKDLQRLSDSTIQSLKLALDIYENGDASLLPQVDPLEDQIDDMAKSFVEKHIQRLKDEVCEPRGGVIFTDMVTDLERCADHATNIAFVLKE